MPYNFAYDINDSYSYVYMGHPEQGDGYGTVTDIYHVALPDGRNQTVN